MEARLLAGQSTEKIAATTNILPSAVRWYEALFFDVNRFRHHRDWVTRQVLLPALRQTGGKEIGPEAADVEGEDKSPPSKENSIAQTFLDGTLKMFAFFGGPFVVDVLIAGFRRQTGRMPRRLGKVVRRAMGADRQASQRQAAQQFEIDKQNVMDVFKMHLHIMKSERSKQAQQSNQHEMGRSIEAMLDALPWATVDDAEKLLQQNASGRFADLPENLTEDELLRLAAGDVAPNGAKKPRKADAGEQQKRAREPR